jgi:hypothetical protein
MYIYFIKNDRVEKLNHIMIAEVKQDRHQRSPIMDALHRHHIREGGISKYCLGVALTENDVKKNNFKARVREIKNKNNAHAPADHS